MSKIPTAEEFLKQYTVTNPEENWVRNGKFEITNYKQAMIEFAKLHVEAALSIANDKAKNKVKFAGFLDNKSILNAYPTGLIK